MVINEEPSLTKRLRVEALKMFTTSLHTVRSYTAQHTYFMFTGFVLIAAGAFSLMNYERTEAVQHETVPVVDQQVQKYTACVFGKVLEDPALSDQIMITEDAECIDAVQSEMFVETEEKWFEQELLDMLAGHPMEQMASAIALQDRTVAGLIVGIARQESQWGVHAPSKGGVDCYNYWGYKTSGARGQVAGGYACFGSPEEAIDVVAKRLDHFVYKTHRDTPAKMVTPWKCGNSCASHSPESVQRWVGTVSTYFNQIVAMDIQPQNEQQNTLLSFNK